MSIFNNKIAIGEYVRYDISDNLINLDDINNNRTNEISNLIERDN